VLSINDNRLNYFIIIVAVVLTNLVAVVTLDILIQDDNARYMIVVTNGYRDIFPWRSFFGIGPQLKWYLMDVMSHSAYLARLIVLLCFMVPVSLLFYIFNTRVLAVSAWVALGTAIIVQSIPALYEFPAFVEGSYPARGMLPFIITLLLTTRFLQSRGHHAALLAVWVLCWVLSNDVMGEMGLFLYPALLFFLFTEDGSSKKKWVLFGASAVVVLTRLLAYLSTYGHPTNSVSEAASADFSRRVTQSLEWWLPISLQLNFALIVSLALAALGVAVYFRKRLKATLNSRSRRALVFYGIWFLSTGAPFWLLSKNFAPRYFYIAYFGLTCIFFILLDQLWVKRSRFNRSLAIAILVTLIGTYSVNRYKQIDEKFSKWNASKQSVYATLRTESIVPGAQIALINPSVPTWGFYPWSTGYLQYAFNEAGISGVIGPELSYYDPFDPESCGMQRIMSCLDPSRPLIAYRYEKKIHLFLQWKLAGNPDSPWILYHSNPDNTLEVMASDTGLTKYKEFLQQNDIDSETVLWGGFKP